MTLEAVRGDFRFTRLERVAFGAGQIRVLGDVLRRRNLGRVLVVTGKTLGGSKLLDRVTGAIGSSLAGVFHGAAQHVPSKTVATLVAEARRLEADCLVSFGGGSPIDTAKAAAMALMGGADRGIERVVRYHSNARGPELFHVAIPTTLSAAEFTPFGGVTDEATREKGGVGDPRLQPRVVILDPELTVQTPAWLWASTGIRALDHAVECSYSARHQVLTDSLATRAIAMLQTHLKASLSGGLGEVEHRLRCQLAAWFSLFGAINTRTGISHALGHQIGPRWNVPHGITSCITLPHVMRFMADAAPDRFRPIADGFGVRFDETDMRGSAMECAKRAARLIKEFEVPTRLRDFEVPRSELSAIAATVLTEVSRAGTVGRAVTEKDLARLLEAAY